MPDASSPDAAVSAKLLSAWQADLGEEELSTLSRVVELGQAHLLTPAGEDPGTLEGRRRLLAQIRALDTSYPGGLGAYLAKARQLLNDARAGANPYVGLTPEVPTGQVLHWGSEAFRDAHHRGLTLARSTGFLLVAGGMGERLGYSGIKLRLPVECATQRSYLEFYVRTILELEREGPRRLPLAIMTSGQTHEPTRRLLAEHDNFGMQAEQITLLRQEEVPALADASPRLVLSDEDPYRLVTKPHGHGDVHALLHSSGLARRWLEQGIERIAFFQDTNALAFQVLPATLAVSEDNGFAMNSITIPRKPGEAVGGIARLVGGEHPLTLNVEYNQLDPMLRATVNPDGDAPDESGYSPFPGNINALVCDLDTYLRTLERTQGLVPEFVNPKYDDAERTRFTKPTRLECMMQDLPRLFDAEARVGFTQVERGVCFSAVKNALREGARRQAQGLPPESASSGEADFYALQRRLLVQAGAIVPTAPPREFGGVEVALFPVVVLSPQMQMQLPLLEASPGLTMTSRASLVVYGGLVIFEGVELDGDLTIHAPPDATVRLRNLRIQNAGRRAVSLQAGEVAPEEVAIRGYRLVRDDGLVIRIETGGLHLVDEEWLETQRAQK